MGMSAVGKNKLLHYHYRLSRFYQSRGRCWAANRLSHRRQPSARV